jgi:hypothetical protein
MLHGAWGVLRTAFSTYRKKKGIRAPLLTLLTQVSSKSVEVAFAALSMPARSLIESVSSDWNQELHLLQQQAQRELDEEGKNSDRASWHMLANSARKWKAATDILIDVLWSGQIADYLLELVLEIQRSSAEDNEEHSPSGEFCL